MFNEEARKLRVSHPDGHRQRCVAFPCLHPCELEANGCVAGFKQVVNFFKAVPLGENVKEVFPNKAGVYALGAAKGVLEWSKGVRVTEDDCQQRKIHLHLPQLPDVLLGEDLVGADICHPDDLVADEDVVGVRPEVLAVAREKAVLLVLARLWSAHLPDTSLSIAQKAV